MGVRCVVFRSRVCDLTGCRKNTLIEAAHKHDRAGKALLMEKPELLDAVGAFQLKVEDDRSRPVLVKESLKACNILRGLGQEADVAGHPSEEGTDLIIIVQNGKTHRHGSI